MKTVQFNGGELSGLTLKLGAGCQNPVYLEQLVSLIHRYRQDGGLGTEFFTGAMADGCSNPQWATVYKIFAERITGEHHHLICEFVEYRYAADRAVEQAG